MVLDGRDQQKLFSFPPLPNYLSYGFDYTRYTSTSPALRPETEPGNPPWLQLGSNQCDDAQVHERQASRDLLNGIW